MKFLHKNQLPLLLIVGSLLLLLLFQGVWLKSSFDQEKETMREQADLVFMEAVREIEDSMLQIALENPLDFFCDENMTVDDISVAFGLKTKTSNTRTNIVVPSSVRTDVSTLRDERQFGSLSFFMATTDSSDYYMPLFDDCEPNNQTKEQLEKKLEKTMLRTDLPKDYQLASFTENEERQAGFYSNTQTDILRGNSYALFFPSYRSFILKKILPQILFSILLFGIMVLSFVMIWHSLEKQRKLTALKNDFISNVTHELKTPITTVGVAIEALSSFNAMDNPQRRKEYLDISKHELNRLTILVDKVLKMSLFEKKEPELKIEQFDLQLLVNEVLGSMKLQFEKFAAKVDFQTKGTSFALEGDRIHLTSVIYNLIDNALKYSPEQPEINLVLEEENSEIKFSVKDKGIGIPASYLDKIFDKFFRVPTGDQHDIKGHGLGLSYVAGVINKHHGKIVVDSKKNLGTKFTISIPKNYG